MFTLSVEERALRAVETALSEITVPNGYNFTIRHVRRIRTPMAIEQITDPPEIHLMFEGGSSMLRGTSERWSLIPTILFFYAKIVRDTPDTFYRLLKSDIQRRISEGVYDRSAEPIGGVAREVLFDTEVTDQPLYYGELPGWTAGEMKFTFRVSWCNRDPRLWAADDRVVTEQ